jgi:hypothetical protein
MTLRQSLILILVVTLVCGAVGLGLGYSLGTLAPDFYRGTFAPPGRALRGEVPGDEFNPAVVRMALRIVQGLGVGLIVSLILVALFLWGGRRSRLQEAVADLNRQVQDLHLFVDQLREEMKPKPSTGFRPGQNPH